MENHLPPDDGQSLDGLFTHRKPRRRVIIVEEKLPPVELSRWDDLTSAEADDMTRGMVTPSISPREIYETFPELCWAVTGPFYDPEGRPYPGTDPETPTCEDIGFRDWQNFALRTSLNYADLIAGRPDGRGGWEELGSEMEARFLNEMAAERMAEIPLEYLPDFLSRNCDFYTGFHPVDKFVMNLADLLESEAGKELTGTRRQICETWISQNRNETPALTNRATSETELFRLNYGDRNAEVIRAIYEGLNGKLFHATFEQWESLFIDNGQPLKRIGWLGTQPQLTTLFHGLQWDKRRIYRMLQTHFWNEKLGKDFDSKQFSKTHNTTPRTQPIISPLLEKIGR